MSRSVAVCTMPRAIGCSESASAEAAIRSASVSVRSSVTPMSTTRNSPSVSVPVLSKMTVSSFLASSSPRRSRTSNPPFAPNVVEIATTSGTANPNACGQAMTRTVAVRTNASSGSPSASQVTRVRAPTAMAT